MDSPVQVVLVGGGHAMLPTLVAAAAWRDDGLAVTLVNDHRYLYYSGMVPEFLGGVYREDEVRIDLADLCRRQGIAFVEAAATRLDSAQRIVYTADGTPLPYVLAAFDIGARNPGVADGAIRTKPLHHVTRLGALLADLEAGRRSSLRLLIAGGGAAGVEVALNLSARFAGPDRPALHLTVVEATDRLLPAFPEAMSRFATDLLHGRGVTVRTQERIVDLTPAEAVLERHGTLPVDAALWATGTVGPALFREAGLPCDPRGFLRVRPTLQSPADPRLFAAGDCAVLQGYEHLPRVGVHAVKQGPTLRGNLYRTARLLQQGRPPSGDDLAPFRPYPAAPLILSTGAPTALWVSGAVWLHGRPFLRLKHLLDRRWIRRYNPAAWGGTRLWQMADAAAAG